MTQLHDKQKDKSTSPVLEGLATAAVPAAAEVDTDVRHPLRFGMLALVLGFGGFIAWAGIAQIDSGVPAPGTVEVASSRKTIQHVSGGTVERILVEEGSRVKRGQLMIQLNSTEARSQLGIAEAQFISTKAVEGRLLAERAGADKIDFSPELAAFGDDARVKQAETLQNQLFSTRRAGLKSELGMFDDQVASLNEQLKGYESLKTSREAQAKWMADELKGIRDLAKDGYVPKNRMFQLERNAADIDGALADTIANIGRVRSSISETRLRKLARQQEYQKEVQSQLTDIQKEAQSLADRLKSARYTVENMDIRSPIDGAVVGLAIHTVGAAVQPSFHIMDVVPLDEPLIVQAQVGPDLVSHVKPGMLVDINFPALDRKITPVIPGQVETVSADRLTDPRTGIPYYLVQAKVTPEGMKLIGQQEIKAGMPAMVVVKTGERTLLNYLIKPMFDRFHSAFKEE